MSQKKRDIGDLELLGGRLCLDFVNTVEWRGTESPYDFLNSYRDFVNWCRHAGLLRDPEAKMLIQKADKNPAEAKKILVHAIELRETIYRLFSSMSEGISPTKKDLAAFNKYLSQTMRESRILETKEGLTWDSEGTKDRLSWILNPIIRSAADLLVSGDLKRVRCCADSSCSWLFFDMSRNRSRRWCDMKDCGNRAKASRFYKRKQLSKATR